MRPMPMSIAPNPKAGGSLMLVEEISHRVLNEYTRAISAISLAAARSTDPGARLTLKEAADELRAYAEAHRVLQAPRMAEMLDLGSYLERICTAMSASTLSASGVRLTLIQNEVSLSADRCWRVGLIVSELITNAARHGLRWGGGDIVVEVTANADKAFCRVDDNGRSNARPTMGRGRTLIDGLAEDLGGYAEWFFGVNGVSVLLHVPLKLGLAPSSTSAL